MPLGRPKPKSENSETTTLKPSQARTTWYDQNFKVCSCVHGIDDTSVKQCRS